MMYGHMFGGGIWMILNFGFWLLVIGGVVALLVLALRRGGSSAPHAPVPPAQQTPKEVAQMRYARGEITREEYNQLLEDLSR